MKGLFAKYGKCLAAVALMLTSISANSTCWFIMHQDKLPEKAKKLRKF